MVKIKRILIVLLSAVLTFNFTLASAFVVRKITVQGLQRIPLSTVKSYLPVKEGEDLDPSRTTEIIQVLYRTGFFKDVSLARQGDTLVITVIERPVIGAIRISGNKEIKTPQLLTGLKTAGIGEGLPFDSSIVQAMKNALEQQYNSQSRYSAKVNIRVSEESENRVGINIDIDEGKVSKIKEIHITGNKAFTERRLLRIFQSKRSRIWSFFTSSDQYIKEKMDSDLDQLKGFYMDHGYLKFKVISAKTDMTPDKKKVFLNIQIEEGPIYKVSGTAITGETLGKEDLLKKLVLIKTGQTFSRKLLLTSRELMDKYLSNQGYALAQVNIDPEVNDTDHTVFVKFNIVAGKRVYVRRISFAGNYKTVDEVLRRELRQMEGAMYCAGNVEESKRRLSNLGYLQNVQVRAVPVVENPNVVDLEYQVTEVSSATANFQVGYSDAYGILYGATLNQTNFLGTGRQVNANFQQNSAATNVSLSYFNPYYTMSGIGRGFTVYNQYATPDRLGITPFRMNTYGIAVTYAIPITEFSRLNFAFGYDNIRLFVNRGASFEILKFVAEHGKKFDQFRTSVGWSRSTYDRAIFPTRGWRQLLNLEAGLPFAKNSLNYYKLSYDTGIYFPLSQSWIIHGRGLIGYGNGYANTGELPFFKNFYAGGIDSVRGYEDNTLGPKDTSTNPIGGNIIGVGSVSLIVPNPFQDQLRTSIFVDAGNVFDDHNDHLIESRDIRVSTGIQFEWISPMGPIHFSFAKALNPGKFDETRVFQFSLGASF